MNVPSRMPSEMADDPITSWSSWNQTNLVDQRGASRCRQTTGRAQEESDVHS